MRTLALLLFLAAGAPAGEAPAGQLKEAYDQALQLYSAGDYRKAIAKWSEILRLDPEQTTAQMMIQKARQTLAEVTRQRREKVLNHIQNGSYRNAHLELQALLDQDPTDPKLQALQTRLEDVVAILPELSARTKAARAAVTGLAGYLAINEDYRLAHNGLRYALELEAGNDRFKRLLDMLLLQRPSLSDDRVTPGMKLLEHKRLVALHAIYDGKYHTAVEVLGEILALEPNDLVSLKQLGSAYYSLGRYKLARQAWNRALALAPDDQSLRKFLSKSPTADQKE